MIGVTKSTNAELSRQDPDSEKYRKNTDKIVFGGSHILLVRL